jgi:hypothetical protein
VASRQRRDILVGRRSDEHLVSPTITHRADFGVFLLQRREGFLHGLGLGRDGAWEASKEGFLLLGAADWSAHATTHIHLKGECERIHSGEREMKMGYRIRRTLRCRQTCLGCSRCPCRSRAWPRGSPGKREGRHLYNQLIRKQHLHLALYASSDCFSLRAPLIAQAAPIPIGRCSRSNRYQLNHKRRPSLSIYA